MRRITWEELTRSRPFKNHTSAITIGVFDGVHRGHQELIQRVTARSDTPDMGAFCGTTPRKTGLSTPIFLRSAQKVFPFLSLARLGTGAKDRPIPTVVTFVENPRRILRPDDTTPDISTLDEKLRLFQTLGVAACILIDFSGGFCQMRGEDFIQTLIKRANMRYLAIGQDFRCGHGGHFGAPAIKTYLEQHAAVCEIVPPVLDNGQPVSSSRIRAALAAGDTRRAAQLLGRGDTWKNTLCMLPLRHYE
ncbi:MAG: FAD synthetase family protein [Spirochaetaceae bacterium]|jgi:FAD synthase|nr:FAD synthetase family protein [Spirochaetaceae bacterium]